MKKTKILALGLAITMLASGCDIQLGNGDKDISGQETSNEDVSNQASTLSSQSKEQDDSDNTKDKDDSDSNKTSEEESEEIEAYREYLRNYYDEEGNGFYATILKIDEDDQYELAVLTENGMDYDVYLYKYEDGQVVSLATDGFPFYGSSGNFYYFDKENCFYYEYENTSGDSIQITEFVFSMQDGEVVLDHEFTRESDFDSDEYTYYVDGEEVDEDTYKGYESDYDIYADGCLRKEYCDLIEDKNDIDDALKTDYYDSYMNAQDQMTICYKPVIYLYPEEDGTEISVQLDIDGEFLCLDPDFNIQSGWNVYADRNGDVHLGDKTYDYLFWEAKLNTRFVFDQGFCVAGDETEEFLNSTLAELGLDQKEISEFIEYWLPIMQQNPYNVISFQTKEYTDFAELNINPKPDTMIRVFMAFYASDSYIEIPAQSFECPEREGFVAVEWGGSYVR